MRLASCCLAIFVLLSIPAGSVFADTVQAGPIMTAQNTAGGEAAVTADPCAPEDPWLNAPEEVLIESEGCEPRKKGPVTLSHKDHNVKYGVACEVCHHFQQTAEPIYKCSECHFAAGKSGKVAGLRDAYHADCKDCHRMKQSLGDSDIAPYMDCGACHQELKK